MKILIDIGHPAHVHYFRNYYFRMLDKGHTILVVSRDKEVCFALLKAYKIPFISRGSGKQTSFGKLIYMLQADWLMYKLARKFKPDVFLSFASPYAAQTAFLTGKPHVALDDTEHARTSRSLYIPFTQTIVTPECYLLDIGKKQIRLPFYAEFTYLHRNVFRPDHAFAKEILGLQSDEQFVLLRFISWSAAHDKGHSGIPDDIKIKLIKSFTDKGFKVFISSEKKLENEFEEYALQIAPEHIHHVISAASFFVGESGTMSNEACILGTPAFLINTLDAGVFRDEVKRGLLFHKKDATDLIEFIHNKLNEANFSEDYAIAHEKLHSDMLDVTDFLINYTESLNKST